MEAESLDAFLNKQDGQVGWETLAALKSEVDTLVGCNLNTAAHLSDKIQQLSSHLGDPVSCAFADASRARVLHATGQHAKASALYESAHSALRAAGVKKEAATILIHQVYALTQMGRYTDALRIARLTRRNLARGDTVKLAQLETNIGNVYYMLDRYKKALKHYDRARELLAGTDDEARLAFVDFSRSNIFTETDRPDEALALLESAADAWERTGRELLASQARFHIAYLQFMRGNYNAALTSYYQSRERLTELGGTQLIAWCDLEIAEILLALNAFDDAVASAASARARFLELGMPYESAKAAMVRSLARMGLEQYEQAERDLMETREVFRASGNLTFAAYADSYLAELALKRGDTAGATHHSGLALRVFARQKLQTRTAHSRLLAARAAYGAGNRAKAGRMRARYTQGKRGPSRLEPHLPMPSLDWPHRARPQTVAAGFGEFSPGRRCCRTDARRGRSRPVQSHVPA